MAKPGPKTKSGKEIVRWNAVRHGVLSTSPVIPGLEREEDWEAHRAGLLASLAPDASLEAILAERVALLLWRLQRVARYERESIALAQERVEEDLRQRRLLSPWETGEDATVADRMSRERLLPDDLVLEKVVRYEAHLNRQLYQALHELEALQTRRSGGIAPLARVDVQGLPE